MASPSVTYTFSNSTTADATQVNQNFTDLINGITDGTKDLSISALTCAGTATLNGNVNIGNASADDLTITASLASSIPIKTTNSYDIGSATIGLRSLYLADAGGAARSTRIIGGTVSSSITVTGPTRTGTMALTQDASNEITNITLTPSVGSSALTIALKTKATTDASSSDPIFIGFRSATATAAAYNQRSVTGSLSVVVSSGSTLGHSSGNNHYIYVYALDNSGTVELAVSTALFDEGTLQSTTAEGGAGAADSNSVLYSTTARASVPIRLLGRMKSNQVTAGTWAAVPTEASLVPFKPKVVAARYSQKTGESMSSGVSLRINYETKDYDSHNMGTTGAGAFKVTVPEAGIYRIKASVTTATNNGTGNATLTIKKNAGATQLSFIRDYRESVTSTLFSLETTTLQNLSAGDYVYAEINQNTGAYNTDTDSTGSETVFEVFKVGEL